MQQKCLKTICFKCCGNCDNNLDTHMHFVARRLCNNEYIEKHLPDTEEK